jgi:hypothetical protein
MRGARCFTDRPSCEIPRQPRAGPHPERRPHRNWNEFDFLVRGQGSRSLGGQPPSLLPHIAMPVLRPGGESIDAKVQRSLRSSRHPQPSL